jgi:hypothetical protein
MSITANLSQSPYFESGLANCRMTYESMNPLWQLTDGEIWAAISYLDGDLRDKQFNANVALIVLIISVVVAMLTLLLHVAST